MSNQLNDVTLTEERYNELIKSDKRREVLENKNKRDNYILNSIMKVFYSEKQQMGLESIISELKQIKKDANKWKYLKFKINNSNLTLGRVYITGFEHMDIDDFEHSYKVEKG